jgi:beta-lactamase regulating signal transducer with metallopeptidase domain
MLIQLLEAALRSFVLGGVVWLSLWALRVHNPQARMTAWTVVLMVSLSMPVLMHWATVPILVSSRPAGAVVAPASRAAVPGSTAQAIEFPREKTGSPPAAENGSPSAAENRSPSAAGNPGGAGRFVSSFEAWSLAGIRWQALALGLYLAVAGGLLLRLAIGLALTWRLLRRGRRINADWAAGSDVRLSAAVVTPVTFGTTILLPVECLDWSPVRLQAVLAHERSHIARADFHVLLLATLHRAVFWFSPFSWWLLNELAETAELISDNAAIEIVGDRPSYAEILLDFASSARQVLAGIEMARTRSAVKRVEHILAVTSPPPPRLGRGRRAMVAMSLAPLIAITTVSFSNQTKTASAAVQPSQPQGTDRSGDLLAVRAAPPELWIAGALFADADKPWPSGDMFNPDSDWKTVAGHTSVIQLRFGMIVNSKDDYLTHIFSNLAERHLALAVELPMLVRSDRCPQRTQAYSDPGAVEKALERIRRLGGDLKYGVMDDPFFFGHRFGAASTCHEPPGELAQQIAENVRLVRTYFPRAEIGTSDVVDESRAWIDELVEWTDLYRRVTGEPLAFFHANVGWSQPAMRNLMPLASAVQARHIPFGIIYNAEDEARSDTAWSDNTRQHIAEVESALGVHPDRAIFLRGWFYPTRLLPETQPGTLTNLAFQYLLAPPSVALSRRSNILSGRMGDAQGHPVASASLTVEALDVAGTMDLVERHLTGKVPADAATVEVGIKIDTAGSAGVANASLGTIRYREEATGRHDEIPPFVPAAADNHPSVRTMQLFPGEPTVRAFKQFPVTPGADYDLTAPMAVSANGERAGHVYLKFLDGTGKSTRYDILWFRPSVRSLGTAVTNADGRFRMEIPAPVLEARSDIRAYFPGSATFGSQTVTVSEGGNSNENRVRITDKQTSD